MNANVRKMLDEIDTFLVEAPEHDAGDLWAVLSALRGPDREEDEHAKSTTTAVIRTAAFPRLADSSTYGDMACDMSGVSFVSGRRGGAEMAHPSVPFNRKKFETSGLSAHFISHLHWAARVLGLVN